jgi:hypothetical protein
VLKAAVAWRDGFTTDQITSPRTPESWTQRLKEICARPPAFLPYNEDEPVINEDEERLEQQAFRNERRIETEAAISALRQSARFFHEEIPRLRAAAENRRSEHALRPVVANPPFESRTEFEHRAGLHWEAMVREARERGIDTETRVTPDLNRHMEWLLAFQLD